MTTIRQYCPEIVNDNLWYVIGKTLTTIQYYTNQNDFTATEVYDNIYVGGIDSSMNKEELKKNNITHIISLINGIMKYIQMILHIKLFILMMIVG